MPQYNNTAYTKYQEEEEIPTNRNHFITRANYTLWNGTERYGTTLGVHDRVEIKLLTIKKDFMEISSFSHIM